MNNVFAHLGIAILLIITPLIGYGQESNFKKFIKLKGPEQRWVLSHQLVAFEVLAITMNTIELTKQYAKNPLLDEHNSGGKLDAFRHVLWMASLSSQIKWKKALRLGNAHEKVNKKDWKKGRYEDGSPPDKIAGEMDYWNNGIGLEIGRQNQNASQEELIQMVLQAITDGKCKIIKRNAGGEFLDAEENIITSSEWQGKWENQRCLIFSNKAG